MVHYQIRTDDSGGSDDIELIAAKGVPEGKIRVSTSGDPPDDEVFFVTMQHILSDSLRPRVTFRSIISYDPVRDAVADAQTEVGQNANNGGDLIMLGRDVDLAKSQASSCLELVADVLLENNVKASMVVVQARRE